MTPLGVVKQAEGTQFRDRQGEAFSLRLLPPLSDAELRALEATLPCPLPQEARELFSYCRGFEGAFGEDVQEIVFSGADGFGLEELCPHAVYMVHDGAGNYWLADLTSDSATWGPIFYVCHDPPVLLYQTDSLAHFITELLRLGTPPWESELTYVHEDERDVWLKNPGVMTQEQCLTSGDAELEAFARSLDEHWQFVDLRRPRLGDGFSWGRYGPQTAIRRFGEKWIFAYREPERKSLFKRLFG